MINFEYIRVSSVKAAIEAAGKNPNARFIAGGTNLVDLMKRGVTAPQRLIDINALPLKQIESKPAALQIGSLALNSDVATNSAVKEKYKLLSMAIEAGASAQLRNMATVGGNILQRTRCPYFYDTVMPCNKRTPGSGCGAAEGYNRMHAIFGASDQCIAVHPSDMCVALAALDARIQIGSAKGERKMPVTDFLRLPGATPHIDNELAQGELITGIEIPNHRYNKQYYLKIRDRASYAFALISVAVALETSGNTITKAALAMGGVAHKPWRLTEVEKFLVGKTTSPQLGMDAAELALQDAKTFQHNAFKIKLGKAAIREALEKAWK
jgi:xanthine dehydrogenase YagS FAD-binding subunit